MKKNRSASKAKPRTSLILQIFPLAVACREIRKINYIATKDLEDGLSTKAMNLFIKALEK